MSPRIDPWNAAPGLLKPLLELEAKLRASGLEHSLQELVKIRASQINGCAYCLHMHTQDARQHGESEARLHLLAAWRESPLYSERERAALAWTEALTRVADTWAPDADYDGLGAHFSDEEKVQLTVLIMAINAWNRLAVGLRSVHPAAWTPDA
ncbi:carboxymuconolactone decarboxylase family protein [Verticiella sediminum]|uniref:Carboxymuconolactone decarboxylase family protein n=1 Tax=Verticiella sediminum TaxID=1247510 RepID=A0A556B1G5_9BURK|nr:carboxymuconolactone decarboxylase family protein [Verticiella sediminum]TSH99038.1 carboxymuconolactone decarboxylase family protein [Verticiella sediminum]